MKKYNGVLESCVVQKYIADPLLLTDRCKFDLRLYVLVTSWRPLVMYLHTAGLTRLATESYSLSELGDTSKHLTNYSINKKNEEYVQNDDAADDDDHEPAKNSE